MDSADPTNPPAVRAVSVLGCETGLRVQFLGDLDAATASEHTFRVERVSGLVGYDPAGRALTFVPHEPFVSGEPYVAVIEPALRSSGGTPMGQPFVWEFVCVDRMPPAVVSRLPLGSDVPTLVLPQVRFSEPIDETSLDDDSVRLVGVASRANYEPATRTLTLTPLRPLYPGRSYTVVVSPRIRDRAGNVLGLEVTWSFRTRAAQDDWAARIVTPPVPGAAPCDTPIELRLSSRLEVEPDSLGVPPIAIDGVAEVGLEYDPEQRIVRLLPGVPLRPGQRYTLVATGTLRDVYGDAPFDTGSALGTLKVVDSCARPTVARVPSASALVRCDAPLQVDFSTAMAPETVEAVVLRDLVAGGYDPASSPVIASTRALSDDGLSVQLVPDAPLVSGRRYWLSVDEQALSAEDVPLAAAAGWEFEAVCDPLAP